MVDRRRKLRAFLFVAIVVAFGAGLFAMWLMKPAPLAFGPFVALKLEPGGSQQLETGGLRIDASIPADEGYSVGSFTIRGITGKRYTFQRDGFPESAHFGDVNGDGAEDIVWVNRSAGSGGYVEIWVFEVKGEQIVGRRLPDLPAEFLRGYGGHDVVGIVDGRVTRLHPIYRDRIRFTTSPRTFFVERVSDANAFPSGGSLGLAYDFGSESWQPIE